MATLPKTAPSSRPKSGLQKLPKSDPGYVKEPASSTSTRPEERSVSASKAKTHLLEILDTIDHKRETLVITKRGRPVARLVPIESASAKSIFGCMKGTIKITGDIVGPEPDIWEAMS